jgi:hypothetical protein
MICRLIKTAKKILMISWRAISVFLEQATAQGTKSTILRPLQWMVLVLGLVLIGILKYGAPNWLLVSVFAVLLLFAVALLVAYFYCLFSGKQTLIDALRTEHYSIQKLAIEKGFRGDSDRGVILTTPSKELSGPDRVENQSEN